MLWAVAVLFGMVLAARGQCPAGCFCTEQSIDCSSRELTHLPHDLSLQIPEHSIDAPYGLDKKAITSLNLANNHMTEWQGKLLADSLPNLVHLDLSNNKIVHVASIQSVLLNTKLLHLKLSYNPIQHLGHNIDSTLLSQSISHLDVSYCQIKSVTDSESIMYLTNLTHLSLSGNPIFVVDNLNSNTLTFLDLSNCLLGINGKGIREESFKNLMKLQRLNVSMNSHLTKFSSSQPLSYSLIYLEASNCAFESPDIRLFPNVRRVVMRRNVIKILHSEILAHNSVLESLDVSENSIHFIEENALMGCNTLRKLDISQNFVTNLNKNIFLHAPRLEVLNVSRNLIKSLDELPLPSLVILDASRCEVFELNPNVLRKTESLRYLNLSHNYIESLPLKLSSVRLLNLDLSYCRLTDLKYESLRELSSLRRLNLMGNRLTNPLNQSLLEEVRELNLQDNPWHCDCSDPDFRRAWKFLSLHPRKLSNLGNLECSSPKEHAGMSWEASCYRVLGEGKKSKAAVWYSFLVPFLSICCLLAIFIVIRQAYVSHGLEMEERQLSQRSNRSSETRVNPHRHEPHFFDEDLERGIQMSVNDSVQRSPIQDLSKLPSYEEALLLPKLLSQVDLKNILKNYEERDRFEQSALDDIEARVSESNEQSQNNPNRPRPSTSRNSDITEE